MYMIGSYLVSKYANTSYMDFATERIFKPTNMSTTTFWPDEVRANGSLTQTWTKFGRRIPSGWPDDVVPLMAGPGGIITSATDLVRWPPPLQRRMLLTVWAVDEVAGRPLGAGSQPNVQRDHHPECRIRRNHHCSLHNGGPGSLPLHVHLGLRPRPDSLLLPGLRGAFSSAADTRNIAHSDMLAPRAYG